MRTQYLHDTYATRVTSVTSEGVYIFTAIGRRKKNMQWRPPYNKKHFEVINFILGHFVNFLDVHHHHQNSLLGS